MASGMEPPTAARVMLRLLLSAKAREIVVGDLDEEYFDSILPTCGATAARTWYWRQALVSVTACWRDMVLKKRSAFIGPRPETLTVAQRRTLASKVSGLVCTLAQEVRYAFRSLVRRPGFSLTILALVALGVGATTTVFSVVDQVLFRSLPYSRSNELVCFGDATFTMPFVRDLRDRTYSLSGVAAARVELLELTGDGPPTHVQAAQITPDFLATLGVSQYRGRLFSTEDFNGPAQVAVVGYRLFLNRWGQDDELIGRTIVVSGQPLTVVGVLPPDFQSPIAVVRNEIDIWIPLDQYAASANDRTRDIYSVIARLREGASLITAQADVDALAAQLAVEHPEEYQHYQFHATDRGDPSAFPVHTLHEATVGRIETTLATFLGAVCLLLLLACANAASMFLARGTDREGEMAVRCALGASRGRVILLHLTESVLLAVVGGVFGVLIAHLGVKMFTLVNPGGIPRVADIAVDIRILAFALLLSVATGIAFGAIPAIQATKRSPNDSVKGIMNMGMQGRDGRLLRDILVVMEVSLTLMLLTGAGLLFSSFNRLINVDPGFRAEGLAAVKLELGERFTEEENTRFTHRLLERVAETPGVEAVAAGMTLPFGVPGEGPCCWFSRRVRALRESEDRSPTTVITAVTPGYFQVLSARMLQGRGFTDSDYESPEEAAPAVLSASLARRLFGNSRAVGESFWVNDAHKTVIGVVEDIRHWSLRLAEHPGMYVPFSGPLHIHRVQLAVESSVPLGPLADRLREAVWEVDPTLPVFDIRPLRELMASSVLGLRFYSTVSVSFAIVATLIAAGGVYGSMLYLVRRRLREMGIRLALGARAINVVTMIVKHGMVLTSIGVALGLAGACAASRFLEGFVFGISPTDPLTLCAVALLMICVALSASYIPARKAAVADLVETLRVE